MLALSVKVELATGQLSGDRSSQRQQLVYISFAHSTSVVTFSIAFALYPVSDSALKATATALTPHT